MKSNMLFHRNNKATDAAGINRNPSTIMPSMSNKQTNAARSKRIRTDFTAMPIPIEKPTSPGRYSFFKGLKNVRRNNGRERRCRKALLTEAKYRIRDLGASRNQNFRKAIGRKK
jgi:hypothetical protein